jgi:hypothetical protein
MQNSTQATICAGKVCATVEGQAAKIVNTIVVAIAFVSLIAVVVKVLK